MSDRRITRVSPSRRMASAALCSLSLLAFPVSSAEAIEIHVDNDAGAPGYTETGSWTTTSNVGAGWNGGLYRFTSVSPPTSTAIWAPVIPDEGFYRVSAIFRRGGDRAPSVPYTINHADGSAQAVVDQTGSFSGDLGQVNLGTYRFFAGSSGNVTLSNTGSGGVYIADTVLFETEPPPEIMNVRTFPLYPQANDPVGVTAFVTDSSGVGNVLAEWSATPSGSSGSAPAVDDGTGDDAVSGDGVYTATLPGFADGDTVTVSIRAEDTFGSSAVSDPAMVTIGVNASWALIINEVLSSNTEAAFDPDFSDSGDWIELYNEGPNTADLTGLAVSDDLSEPDKWVFPPGSSLPVDDYLLVWCDDKDFTGAAFHTNFRLSSGGEEAVLYDTITQTVVDSTEFPPLETDQSWARIPNLTGDFAQTIIPTPEAENLAGSRGDAPVFSHASGAFDTAISVEITAPGSTEIRFTTDGREPVSGSTLYSGPVVVSSTTGLRARAWYTTQEPSLTTSASYLFGLPADREIPVISLVLDPEEFDEIHTNFDERGRAWERGAFVAVMSPDGSVVQESGAGLRLHGGFSRSADKRSFRLYFRNAYGNREWSLPWLERSPNDSFEQLVLRAGGNDGFLVPSTSQLNEVTLIRDQVLRDWFADQGHFAADGFFGALYINGEYRGIYNATERISNDTMERVSGADEWDIIKGSWTFETKFFTEATDGDPAAWNDFLAWHTSSDLSTDQDFEELKERIDYRNFLDWMALNIVAQNEDWPHNNWISSRERGNPAARFSFHEWDAEWGLGLRPQGWQSDTLLWTQGDNFHNSASHNGFIAPLSNLFNGNDLNRLGVNPPVNGILDHPQGVRDFVSAVEDFLNFEFATEKATEEFDAYVSLLETEIPREAARWHASSIFSESQLNSRWPVAVQNLRNFIANRPAIVRNLITSEFGLPGTRRITFNRSGSGEGTAAINGHVVSLPWTGTFFDGSITELIAIPAINSQFDGWTGAITSSEPGLDYSVSAGGDLSVTLVFNQSTGEGPLPGDVIFNEYWVNDDPTDYLIGMIEGDWIELLVVRDMVDMRGMRLTDNENVGDLESIEDGDGSLILPEIPALAAVRSGTIILVLSSTNETNDASFPADDLDAADGRLVFYRANGSLDETTDPGFGLGTDDGSIALVAPGALPSFLDDIGIDFIAEGLRVTPETFFNAPSGVFFPNPFGGIGTNDGAVFLNDGDGMWNNDDGQDPVRGDFVPGPGGWIVDPGATFTGDEDAGSPNLLTPGYPNTGQIITPLIPPGTGSTWSIR